MTSKLRLEDAWALARQKSRKHTPAVGAAHTEASRDGALRSSGSIGGSVWMEDTGSKGGRRQVLAGLWELC